MKTVADGLKILLADTYMMVVKTQNAHWNYEGEGFYSLHILFEKQYQELAEAVDEIAERIRALGSKTLASFSGFKEKSNIQEGKEEIPSKDMIEDLVAAHKVLICHVKKLSEVSEKDGATLDLLARRLGVHEKFIWMLRSSL